MTKNLLIMFCLIGTSSGAFRFLPNMLRAGKTLPRRHGHGVRMQFARSVSASSLGSQPTPRDDAMKIIYASIRAVDPRVAVQDRLKVEKGEGGPFLFVRESKGLNAAPLSYDLSEFERVRIVSFGKASTAMARSVAEVLSLSNVNIDGVVISKDGHATDDEKNLLSGYNIRVREASHPIPCERSVSSAEEIMEVASSSDSRTLLIACISGGGSALFCLPRGDLTLNDLMETNARLLESGAPIQKMNIIRKRLEMGKGGLLATAAYPATTLGLVLSDIVGDPLDLIASGPTVPDESSFEEAWSILREYGMGPGGSHELPPAVIDVIREGNAAEKALDNSVIHPAFKLVDDKARRTSETVLVGNNRAAVLAAAEEAEKLGYSPAILGTRFDGEASCVGGSLVAMADHLCNKDTMYPIAATPAALISGGETIVNLPQNCKGRGGRNQELALAAALKMNEMNLKGCCLASIGTDGTDGPTDAAGAIVDSKTVDDDVSRSSALKALSDHDSYDFLNERGCLVMTGPTGTNVADVCITLIR